MSFRKSLSKAREKVKHGLARIERKLDRIESDTVGERAGSTISLPRPEPQVVVGGRPVDQPLHPDGSGSMSVRGGEGDKEGKADVDGGEANQKDSRQQPEVEVAAGTEPSREGNDADGGKVGQIYPSPSTTSIPHIGGSDSK